ncbi:MAG: zinc ribbon domain-containing protein [Planctomycetaceae bacterium]|nr:zinc ribbon domain-containing protein [Planctomycetaceae bacterium]
MPLFEFHCEDCNKDVELLIGRTEKPVCPKCGSKKMEKLMSAAAGRVAGGSLPVMGGACPPPEAGPCSPHCCRLPQ